MKLSVMQKRSKLPQEAGGVPIKYKGQRWQVPRVLGRSILMPRRFGEQDEFFPLQGGRQFLFRQRVGKRPPRLFFAGMDEQHPFVTDLHLEEMPLFLRGRHPWGQFKQGGEAAFYQSLKSRLVRKLEKAFKIRSIRQGDWWALHLVWDVKRFCDAYEIHQGEKLVFKKVTGYRLYRTNHRFSGMMAKAGCYINGLWFRGFIVVGTIEARHHAPLRLSSFHLLVRSGRCGD